MYPYHVCLPTLMYEYCDDVAGEILIIKHASEEEDIEADGDEGNNEKVGKADELLRRCFADEL